MTRAEVLARAFVSEHGIDCIRKLSEIAPRIGLEILEVDADNFEGALVRAARIPCGTILISRAIREPGRRFFTLAHELGHYVLHDAESHPCRRDDLENFGSKVSPRELEANAFAAEVTMPMEVVRAVAAKSPSLETVAELAALCGTSLTASAYRLVGFTSHAVAVVWSQGGVARWFHRSVEFKQKVRLGVLSPLSLASSYFGNDRPGEADAEGDVPGEAWLYEDAIREGAELHESTRFLSSYDATLTLLLATTLVEASRDFDDPEDGELDPDEFTLGRRRWPSRH